MSNEPETDGERIVHVAAKLFYSEGIQAVGMDAVRTAAGVSLKRLYSAFPSKDALVAEVLRYRRRIWDAGIAAAASDSTSAEERLLAIFDFLDAWFRTDDFRGCGFINAFGEYGTVSAEVVAIAREQKADFQQYVAGLVADLGGPPELAAQLALLAEGAQTTAAISGTPDAAAQARRGAATLIRAAVA